MFRDKTCSKVTFMVAGISSDLRNTCKRKASYYHIVRDAAVIIPPRANAVPSPAANTAPSQRDQHLRMIQDRRRMGWQKVVGYGRRSLGETAVFRYKTIIGRGLRARTLSSQKIEARVACSVLNRMT